MADKITAVFGVYKTIAQAERALVTLKTVGYMSNDISVLLTDAFAHEKNTKNPGGDLIGGTLEPVAGLGTVAIPGPSSLLAAGPILAALAGTETGGIGDALAGMGIAEYEARRYEGQVKNGGVLISVHCATSFAIGRARELLKATGAGDISSTSEAAIPHVTTYAR
jgi:hypothetical protein